MIKQKLIKYLTNNFIQFILFSGLLWLIFVHLHINRHIEDIIIGPHYWRKSDTYAQIMNYYYNNLNFFDHGLYFNQMTGSGSAVAEFPIIYWLIALQMKIFGPSYLLIKINYIILLFAGLFSLYRITLHFTKNYVLSIFVAIILFLSPVFSFYSLAYLPDPLALYISLIGMWFLIKSTEQSKYLFLAIILISIAGMIKPFFLIPYLSFLGTVVLNQILIKKDFIKFKWHYLIPILLVVLWFVYTNWYNETVNSEYFLSKARPIWNYDSIAIQKTWKNINERWLVDYINTNLLWLMFGLILINIGWWQKRIKLHQIFYTLSVLGCLAFVILFFNMFEHHDYYIFPILFILPLTIGFFIFKITKVFQLKVVLSIIGLVCMLFVFLGLDYTYSKIEARRSTPWINSKELFENYTGLEYFLLKNNIKKTDYIFTFSDKSPSFALSLLNRKGWSGFQTKPNKFDLQTLINKGASVLILNKNAPYLLNDSIIVNKYLNYPMDDTNNIYIYNLKPYKK